MTMPVPAHISLEEQLTVQQNIRDNADVYYAGALPALEAINEQTAPLNGSIQELKGGDAITLTELNNLLGLILASLDTLRGTVDTLAGTVELLNNNASQNAQQLQNIVLGQFGACCVETAYGTGEVDDLCQLSQDAIAFVVARMLSISATYSGNRLPTVDELVRLFTYVGTDGRSYPLLAASEAGQLLATLAALGVGSLSELGDLLTDEGVKAAVLELLGTSNSAEQSYIRIRALSGAGFTISPAAARAFFAAFSPTLINTLWKSTPIWDASPYEDICSDVPPFEGAGWDLFGATWFPSDGPEEVLTRVASSFDMAVGGTGNLAPQPHDSPGQTLFVYCCFNFTTSAEKVVQVRRSAENGGETLCDVWPGEAATITVPPEQFLEVWACGTSDTGGSQLSLVIAWDTDTAAAHCPS